MRRLAVVLALVAAVAGAFLVVHETQPDWYAKLWHPLRYETIVRGHARNYDLDPALLAAVIYAESKFDANARSSSGAIGLMQLLPDTAKGIAARIAKPVCIETRCSIANDAMKAAIAAPCSARATRPGLTIGGLP